MCFRQSSWKSLCSQHSSSCIKIPLVGTSHIGYDNFRGSKNYQLLLVLIIHINNFNTFTIFLFTWLNVPVYNSLIFDFFKTRAALTCHLSSDDKFRYINGVLSNKLFILFSQNSQVTTCKKSKVTQTKLLSSKYIH